MTPQEIESLRLDLSVARQSLYEVADQRDAFYREVKRLRTALEQIQRTPCDGNIETCDAADIAAEALAC